ncbi:hypothetical protein CBS101457_003120 [Exobasidium rhododendri]|nr:hypothetical protein CBS101457_003120 [Exobasidium rhododendri]
MKIPSTITVLIAVFSLVGGSLQAPVGSLDEASSPATSSNGFHWRPSDRHASNREPAHLTAGLIRTSPFYDPNLLEHSASTSQSRQPYLQLDGSRLPVETLPHLPSPSKTVADLVAEKPDVVGSREWDIWLEQVMFHPHFNSLDRYGDSPASFAQKYNDLYALKTDAQLGKWMVIALRQYMTYRKYTQQFQWDVLQRLAKLRKAGRDKRNNAKRGNKSKSKTRRDEEGGSTDVNGKTMSHRPSPQDAGSNENDSQANRMAYAAVIPVQHASLPHAYFLDGYPSHQGSFSSLFANSLPSPSIHSHSPASPRLPSLPPSYSSSSSHQQDLYHPDYDQFPPAQGLIDHSTAWARQFHAAPTFLHAASSRFSPPVTQLPTREEEGTRPWASFDPYR